MRSLFDQSRISGVRLKNRFIRSATRDGLSDARGHLTGELIASYERLAEGGVGAIITGHAFVTDAEQSKQPGQMGLYADSLIAEYAQLAAAVHRHGAALFIQLSCVGAQTYTAGEDRLIWGPSRVEDLATKITPEPMTRSEIRFLQEAFAQAALRAKEAAADGVQIHAAHGYVLNKFLNPYYNRRSDEYGGSFENRARMVIETYAVIREQVGSGYPVLIKLNCSDFMDGGMTFAECVELCKLLDEAGIDAIEVSGGSFSSDRDMGPVRIIKEEQESYFQAYAAAIAKEVKAPVILVGGNRNIDRLAGILNFSKIELISLSRPLIREPGLIWRWQTGDRNPAKCLSCNKCLGLEKTHCPFHSLPSASAVAKPA